jgi:ubiquinone/menaquinone biosynthesis C-methylase UbiE
MAKRGPEFENPPGSWGASEHATRGEDYDARFDEIAATGVDMHGEATFVEALGVHSVLDAGCGTGRVAIELARRGLDVVGVDADPGMLSAARVKAPELEWIGADLSVLDLPGRRFDAAVMAGNVMIFVVPGTEGAVLERLAAHLEPGGLVVAGFQLVPGGLDLARYDELAEAAGLVLADRYATWDREAWTPGGGYAVSVHRLAG